LTALFLVVFQMGFAQKRQWIPFEWSGYQAKTRYFDKSAILVKTQMDDLSYPFRMQFDLGATNTVIYGKTFQSFKQEFAAFEQKLDASDLFQYNGKKYPTYKPVNLKLGGVDFKNLGVGKYSTFGTTVNLDTMDMSKS
jgi:nucleoside-specific outer membrane channel protein Tsx